MSMKFCVSSGCWIWSCVVGYSGCDVAAVVVAAGCKCEVVACSRLTAVRCAFWGVDCGILETAREAVAMVGRSVRLCNVRVERARRAAML